MPVQFKSILRYIHPYAHLWPDPAAARNKTDLPLLNWEADTADNVRKVILKEYESIEPLVITRKGYTVSGISTEGGHPVITYRSPRFEREKEAIHAVIAAVGFGREKGRSYWEPDGLEYLRYAPGRRVVVISGCGDGGIVDVLRLRLDDFTHEAAVSALVSHVQSAGIAAEVAEVEVKAQKIVDEKLRGSYLDAQYRSMAQRLPDEIKSSILARLRGDTKVHLVSPYAVPFSAQAMPVNRMLLAILLTSDTVVGLEYHEGRTLEKGIEYEGGLPIVKLSDNPLPEDPIECEQVLLRHGPTPVVDAILPKSFVDNLRAKHSHFLSPTDMALRPFWPDNHFGPSSPPRASLPDLPKASPASGFGSQTPYDEILYCGAPLLKGKTTGTLGCFVSLKTGETGFLSTAHFLAEGEALGERIVARTGKSQRVV
jgi:hypothetical protein